jgi:hypothetical protein
MRHSAAAFALRVLRLVSQEEAATAAGRSVKTWRNYENTGRGRITGALLKFVAHYRTGPKRDFVNLAWLVTGDGPPPVRLRLVCSNSEREIGAKAVQS